MAEIKDQTNVSDIGYVYILTNPYFKDNVIKIGKSSRPVDIRSTELDNTSVPSPFEIYATVKVSAYNSLEDLAHEFFKKNRIRPNREFFVLPPEEALSFFQGLSSLNPEVTRYKNNEPLTPKSKERKTPHPAPPFKYEMIGMGEGEELTFIPTGVKVKTSGENKVVYEGQEYSMSGFTKQFLPEKQQVPSGAYQGPKFFSWGGKSLVELRKEKENK